MEGKKDHLVSENRKIKTEIEHLRECYVVFLNFAILTSLGLGSGGD